ncbi:hypothetical protein [Paenibacillus mucilaginosus]|uniref:hypothetical protein n=1 Tax=Paenibacillus mucilaginosus TaxID=61624 RepID=UPI001EE6680A|nr:hypothetical protein [Paenibacillus mucilaginosus]
MVTNRLLKQGGRHMGKKQLVEWILEHQSGYEELAREIWERPETAYEESFASGLLGSVLEREGFRVRREIGGIPTAFVAEYGTGGPILGILGEYDALPGLSQKVSAVREPVSPDGPGHGCGHHLLGTAGVEAAVALKHRLDAEGLAGTIRYYGCPAEEVLSGKNVHGARGRLRRPGCGLDLASRQPEYAMEHPYLGADLRRASLPRTDSPCGRGSPSGSERPGCRGADEHRRELLAGTCA